MSKINNGRVIIGGLLAGIVITIGEFILNGLVVADQWATFAEQHGLPSESASMVVAFVLVNFAIGLSLVFLYALIRPRCGAGPKTALQAGVFVWFMIWLIGFGSMGPMFGMPANLIVITLIWGLVEVCLAGLAGGWAYKEDG